jgi:hypothetical protein
LTRCLAVFAAILVLTLFFSFIDDSFARHESQRDSDGTIDGLPGYLPEECYIYDSMGKVLGAYPQGNCGEQFAQQTSGSNMTSGNTTYPPYNYDGTSSSPQSRINWGQICMNPLVDYIITEPCYTLTTPDGYTLTSEGERVLRYLAAGVLIGVLDPQLLVELRELGPAVNCGGQQY